MTRIALLLIFLATSAYAGELRVIDGDTFVLDGEHIRIENIDTPELHAKCAEEYALAHMAKDRLEHLLREHGGFAVIRLKKGKYGRTIARVQIPNGDTVQDVGEILIKEGYARPWTGRRMPWCEGEK